ncbi:MAG: hypothetical protein VW547_06315 [Alphaproteobacteria bacterium]
MVSAYEDLRKKKAPKLPGTIATEAMPDGTGTADQPLSPVDDGQTQIKPDAGPTPAGAIGGGDVINAQQNMQDSGTPADTYVGPGGAIDSFAGGPAPTVGTTDLDSGYKDEDGDGILDKDEEGAIDSLAEQFVQDQFQRALNGGDTAERERLIREQAADALGQGLMDSRARAGRAGFSMGGMQAALEQDARTRSQRQVALDIIDARIEESQRLIDNALAAGRYDLAAQAQANQDALTQARIDAFNAIVGGGTDASVGTNPDDPSFGNIINDATHGGADVNNTQLHTPGVPDGQNVVEQSEADRDRLEGELRAGGYVWETVTDDGVTVYRKPGGNPERLYVRYG